MRGSRHLLSLTLSWLVAASPALAVQADRQGHQTAPGPAGWTRPASLAGLLGNIETAIERDALLQDAFYDDAVLTVFAGGRIVRDARAEPNRRFQRVDLASNFGSSPVPVRLTLRRDSDGVQLTLIPVAGREYPDLGRLWAMATWPGKQPADAAPPVVPCQMLDAPQGLRCQSASVETAGGRYEIGYITGWPGELCQLYVTAKIKPSRP